MASVFGGCLDAREDLWRGYELKVSRWDDLERVVEECSGREEVEELERKGGGGGSVQAPGHERFFRFEIQAVN